MVALEGPIHDYGSAGILDWMGRSWKEAKEAIIPVLRDLVKGGIDDLADYFVG